MREDYGRWPWRRSLYALLLSYLHEADARAIGIDVTFAGADAHEGDDELFAHYLGQKADTVLALSFTDSPGAVEPEDSDLQPNQWRVENTACGPDRQYTGLDIALSKLNQKTRALGSTTVERDPDGFLRRAPLLFRYGGAAYPAFALAVAAPWLGSATGHRSAEFRCGNLLTAGSLSIGDLEIPVTADGDAMVYWYGGQSGSEYSFRHYPTRRGAFPMLPWTCTTGRRRRCRWPSSRTRSCSSGLRPWASATSTLPRSAPLCPASNIRRRSSAICSSDSS